MTTQHPSTVGDPRDTNELRERSLPELLKQLSADTTRLVHQELELAKAELAQKGRQAGAGAGLFGAAGAIGLLGAAALTTCFILALDAVMPAWLAALLVAVVYGGQAGPGQAEGGRSAGSRADDRDGEGGRGMGQDPDAIREDIEQTRADMSEAVEAIGYKADVPSRAKDKVSQKVEDVKSKVSQTATRAKEAVTGTTSRVGDAASGTAARVGEATPTGGEAKQQAKRAVGLAKENPLGLAVGAVALGFLAGLVVPSTRVENERLGPVADQVKDKVKETGQEALDRGKQVAQEAASSAADTAKRQGRELGQDLAQSAKQNAQDVRDQATQTTTRS
jgi:hypothetical protein